MRQRGADPGRKCPHLLDADYFHFLAHTVDVQRYTEFPRGGHFVAFEEPQLLAADLRAFFRPLRGN
jgi:pimeloyl-ACP methyl ester carboxylesterase